MTTSRGWEEPLWARLAGELGLPGVLLPAEHGGSGLGGTELALVMEEAGAALVAAPLLSTAALAVPLLLACGDGATLARYGHRISAGELTATVALTEDDGRWSTVAMRTTARRRSSGWELDGTKNYVVDGATSGMVLVGAATDDGLGVFAVDADAPGLHREPLATLDLTRKQARLTFTRTPATAVGPADATDAVERASDFSRAMLAAEQVGGAQRCLDMTAEHARTRTQFGRPIGGFQAVKQRLAEMLIQVGIGPVSRRGGRRVEPPARTVRRGWGSGGRPGDRGAHRGITCTDAYTWVTAAGHPAARRDRVHLGARCTPLFQARPGRQTPARHPFRARRGARGAPGQGSALIGVQRPLKRGSRFSTKAARPSGSPGCATRAPSRRPPGPGAPPDPAPTRS